MAVLSSIRSRGKLIAVCVGGALLAFILGDFINSGATLFNASQTKMGAINGNSIEYDEFQSKIQEREQFIKLLTGRSSLDSETSDEIREYCWEQLIRSNTIGNCANKQGIIVTDQEVATLIQSGNVTPTIRQAFTDPQTGVYNPAFVSQFIQNSTKSAEGNFIWNNMENELREMRQYVKYINMVSAGLYATNADVEKEFAQRTQMADIKYVSLPLSDVKDEDVKISESDIKKQYDENKLLLERNQETRDIAYVRFDVIPSMKDSAEALEVVNKIKDDFLTVSEKDVVSFINSKSDVPYSNYHYSKGDIQNSDVDSVMFADEIGCVYGPYVEGEYYKLARLINKGMRSDSVKAQHILVAFQQSNDSTVAKVKADSLLDVYKSGVDFGALAMQFSDDQGSASDSGNLGWIVERTPFIPEFKDACFATDKGKTTIVRTSYGYHIIKVTDKTAPKQKVEVGFIYVDIRPSTQTRQEAYAKASKFAAENRKPAEFEKAVEDQKLLRLVAPGLSSNTRQVSGLENSRELVRWAFNDEESKQVSDVKEYGDHYIVAALTAIHPKGVPAMATIKNELTTLAMNSAKGDVLVSKIGTPTSVDEVANKMGKTVQEAHNVNFEMTQIPGIGFEPAVIAVASSLGQNQVSAPIKGKNGVYVIQNVSLTPAQAIQPLNLTTDKSMIQNDYRNRCTYMIPQVITKMANIEDRRVKFF